MGLRLFPSWISGAKCSIIIQQDPSAFMNVREVRPSMERPTVIIPALAPDDSLIFLAGRLRGADFPVVIVDDGSGTEYEEIFHQARKEGCAVVHHEKNLGKGAAVRTGIREAKARYGSVGGWITADADGQHLPEDIIRVAEKMADRPDALVLGTRQFSAAGVPFRSRLGNRVTSALFRLTSGISCPDTQTGLRGIPAGLEPLALSEEGDRYEYEMNFLSDAARMVPLVYVPIRAVYRDGNRTSHFRPLADSARVYGRFLRFTFASLAGAATDYLLFYLLSRIIRLPRVRMIFAATAIARVGSGLVNFGLNRRFSFRSKRPVEGEALRYAVLFLGQMAASAGLVAALSRLPIPLLAAKAAVDTGLFLLSYRLQKNWVFRKGRG